MMRHALLALLLFGCPKHDNVKATKMTTLPPSDLNVAQLIGELGPSYAAPDGTPTMPKDDAVRVLAEFKDAGLLTALPQAGEELWFGKSYDVKADVNSFESYVFMRIKPQDDGFIAFATALVTDGWQEDADASNIVHELKTGAPVKPSHAYKYMKSTPPDDGYAPLTKSDGVSMVLTSSSPRWLRQKDNRILMIQHLPATAPGRSAPYMAAGRYAELWHVP
jgi:hypothetical protein